MTTRRLGDGHLVRQDREHQLQPCLDRAKAGSKLHLATDAEGLPLAMALTAASVNDALLFEALLDDLPAVRTPRGQRRSRPGKVCADKAYDHRHCRHYLAARRIASRIARRRVESSTRLGRQRWKLERSLACSLLCVKTLRSNRQARPRSHRAGRAPGRVQSGLRKNTREKPASTRRSVST